MRATANGPCASLGRRGRAKARSPPEEPDRIAAGDRREPPRRPQGARRTGQGREGVSPSRRRPDESVWRGRRRRREGARHPKGRAGGRRNPRDAGTRAPDRRQPGAKREPRAQASEASAGGSANSVRSPPPLFCAQPGARVAGDPSASVASAKESCAPRICRRSAAFLRACTRLHTPARSKSAANPMATGV